MNSSLSEIFRILSLNVNKVNYLRSALDNNRDNIFLKMKQFLSEFEYDLKIIYDILDEYIKDNSSQKNNHKNKALYLDDFQELFNHYEFKDKYSDKAKDNKKYNLTINICNDRYFDTKKGMPKKFNKSNSCKSYNKPLSKNIIKNLKRIINNSYSERRNKNKSYKNQNYLANKRMKDGDNYHLDNYKFRTNINKNKDSLKNLKKLCNYYNELINKNNYIKTNNNINSIKLDLDNETYNNNIPYNHTLSEENKNNFINNYNYIKDYKNNIRNTYEIKNYDNNKVIYQKIIKEIFDDNNKLNELKKLLGNNIGDKILKKNLNYNEINIINDYLENNNMNCEIHKSDKNLFRKNYRNYRNYKEEEYKNDIFSSFNKNKNNIHNYINNDDRYNNY